MESSHSFTASHTIYYDTVTRFRDPEINSYQLSANAATETLITVLVQVRRQGAKDWSPYSFPNVDLLLSQCFYSHRIYRLSKGNLPISIACFTLAILRFLFGIAVSAESVIDVHRTPNWVVFVTQFNWLITAMLSVGGAADILIAISMLVYLRKMSSSTNMQSWISFIFCVIWDWLTFHHSTTNMINRLVRWSLREHPFCARHFHLTHCAGIRVRPPY